MLPQTILNAARRFGERAAFRLASGASVSYSDLDRASDEVAAGLAVRGLGEGDVLLLSLPSGPEIVNCWQKENGYDRTYL